MSQELKQKIKEVAVEYFNKDGYHGTTIRNIANEVGCSLPMVYYYYQNKYTLFYEIITKDYFDLLKRQAKNLDTEDILVYYTQFVFNLNYLSDYERKIYRLGIKVYLSFDGDDALLDIMNQWEQSILPRHYEILMPHLQSRKNADVIVRVLIHLLENLIESIVVKNRRIPKKEIKEELAVLLGSS